MCVQKSIYIKINIIGGDHANGFKTTLSCAVMQVRADTIIFIHVLKLIRRFGNILNLHVVMKKSVIINFTLPIFGR